MYHERQVAITGCTLVLCSWLLLSSSTTSFAGKPLVKLISTPQKRTELVVVTAASSNHFCWLTKLIASIRQHEPNVTIVFYDLGLVEPEIRWLESVHGLEYRRFPYEKYPKYFDVHVASGQFAWKPVVIAEELEQAEYVVWMDAGNTLETTLQSVRPYLDKYGFLSDPNADELRRWTHPGTLKYLKVNETILDKIDCNAAFLGFSRNHTKDTLVKQWAECAQHKDCIAPIGSNRENHRQDQAVLSILAWQLPQQFTCETKGILVRYVLGLPLENGFGSSTTGSEIAKKYSNNIAGKVAFVTGGTGGLGFLTAQTLAKHGATVYITARTAQKGEQAVKEIKQQVPSADVRVIELDLASLDSIRKGVEKFKSENVPLHYLINNAGVMFPPYQKTEDGFELQFGTNHLGHFLLTELLVDKLKASAPSRVVNVSSLANWAFTHPEGIPFDDLDAHKGYNASQRYGISKLANILHAREFNRLHQDHGVTAYSLHPGNIATDLARHVIHTPSFLKGLVNVLLQLKTVDQGIATTLYCTLSPDAIPGEYYADSNVDHAFVNPFYNDTAMAERLYKVSRELVGLK